MSYNELIDSFKTQKDYILEDIIVDYKSRIKFANVFAYIELIKRKKPINADCLNKLNEFAIQNGFSDWPSYFKSFQVSNIKDFNEHAIINETLYVDNFQTKSSNGGMLTSTPSAQQKQPLHQSTGSSYVFRGVFIIALITGIIGLIIYANDSSIFYMLEVAALSLGTLASAILVNWLPEALNGFGSTRNYIKFGLFLLFLRFLIMLLTLIKLHNIIPADL